MSSTPPESAPGTAPPSSAPKAAAPTLADIAASLLKPAATTAAKSAGGSMVKTAAMWYGGTLALAVAMLDLKFNLGLGHSFDAGLIGASLSAFLGRSISL